MEPNLNQERQQAHALLDMLPADKLNAVRGLLEVMVGTVGTLFGVGSGGRRRDHARDGRSAG